MSGRGSVSVTPAFRSVRSLYKRPQKPKLARRAQGGEAPTLPELLQVFKMAYQRACYPRKCRTLLPGLAEFGSAIHFVSSGNLFRVRG